MRKLLLVGVVTAGSICTNIAMTAPASAWDDCGYRSYGYYAPRAYSYAPSPYTYRSYYRPTFFYGSAFRGWRGGWGGRHWGRRW